MNIILMATLTRSLPEKKRRPRLWAMLSVEIFILYLFMYGLFVVGGLSFFNRGSVNHWWIITYIPFLLAVVVLITTFFDWSPPVTLVGWLSNASRFIATVLCCFAITLYVYALNSGQYKQAMWHQLDGPDKIIITKAYRYIRHPIYTAYILFFVGAVFAVMNIYMLIVAIYGVLILNYTANKEEREILNTERSAVYRDYMRATGKFFPRFFD